MYIFNVNDFKWTLVNSHIKLKEKIMEKYTIRNAVVSDANSICQIYNHYVLNTTVTFETSAVATDEMEKRIYEALFKKLDKGSLHAIIAGVAQPNEASARLHERFGFEKVAHFKQTGRKFNQWIDVAYWEIIL